MAMSRSNSNFNQQLRGSVAGDHQRSSSISLSPNSGSDPPSEWPLRSRPFYGFEPVDGVDQMGLSQRVTELRRTQQVTPQRARVLEGVTEFVPIRNHSALPAGRGVSETEPWTGIILGEHLFSSASARKRMFCIIPMQNNRENHPFTFHNQSENSDHSQTLVFCSAHSQQTQSRFIVSDIKEPSNVAQGNEFLNPTPIRACFPPKFNNPSAGKNLQNLHSREIANDEDNVDGDGQTHSLPCHKYGPYICPKCMAMFSTSQRFAAHMMSSNYRLETAAQRRRRSMARIGRKSLHLCQSKDGLTVVPYPSKSARNRNAERVTQRKAGPVKVEAEAEVQGYYHQHAPPGKKAYGNGSSGVKIKAEPGEIYVRCVCIWLINWLLVMIG